MASKTTTIQVRVDEELKKQAVEVLGKMHITMSQAVKMFLGQLVHNKRIPMDVFIPNEETIKAMEQVDRDENMFEVDTVEELMEELER